jgi:hypothetical protein
MCSTSLILVLLVATTGLLEVEGHGFFRGYRNGRSWGLGSQRARKAGLDRMGRQDGGGLASPGASCLCQAGEEAGGAVCGSDGETYASSCSLRAAACRATRRQGRSFQSRQLRLEVSHQGPCRWEPAPHTAPTALHTLHCTHRTPAPHAPHGGACPPGPHAPRRPCAGREARGQCRALGSVATNAGMDSSLSFSLSL